MEVRAWEVGDDAAIAALLDPATSVLWRRQFHSMHGAPIDAGGRWSQTLVAETGGTVVGAATLGVNRVHPGRYAAAVDVALGQRRQGIGRALVDALLEVRREPLALAAKVYDATRRQCRSPGHWAVGRINGSLGSLSTRGRRRSRRGAADTKRPAPPTSQTSDRHRTPTSSTPS